MIRRLSFIALVFLAAGCSGGGGGSASLPAGSVNAPVTGGASGGTANAQVQILIPAPTTVASSRRAQYISSSTQSLVFAPATGNPIVVPLTPTSPGCSAGTNGTTCTVNVPLPVGANQQFLVSTFASTDGSGTALSVTKVTQSIVAGQVNPIALTLFGVPKTVTLTAQTAAIPSVAATSIPVTVTVKDASGSTIVGNSSFSDANGNAVTITLADSDTTGATKITPATLTAPGSASVAYDNYFQPTTAAITAGGTGLTNSIATLTFAQKAIAYTYSNTDTVQSMFSARASAQSLGGALKDRRRAAVAITPHQPLTLAALVPATSGSAPYQLGTNVTSQTTNYYTMIPYYVPFGMATAPSGHLYFTQGGTSYGMYDAGTTPTLPASTAVIAGTASQVLGPIALGPGGKTYAAIPGGFEQIDPTTGLALGSPVMLPSQFKPNLISHAIAVGPDGTVYLEAFEVSSNNDDVVEFSPSGGSFTFARSFWTGNSHFSGDAIFGLAVDLNNKVYVSCDNYGTIDVVPAASSGNVLPAMVYTNYNNQDDGLNVIVDRAGNIIWAAWNETLVFAPNTGGVPPPNTDPTTVWYPADSTPLQTITGIGGNAVFGTLTFGPGS